MGPGVSGQARGPAPTKSCRGDPPWSPSSFFFLTVDLGYAVMWHSLYINIYVEHMS
jgi:hypothetical protein